MKKRISTELSGINVTFIDDLRGEIAENVGIYYNEKKASEYIPVMWNRKEK